MPVNKPFRNPLHNNPDTTELMLICEGEGTFIFDGKTYVAGARSIMLYNQALWHDERSHEKMPFRTLYLGISGLRMSSLPEGYLIERDRSPIVPLGDAYFDIERRLREVVEEKNSDKPEAGETADYLLMAFLVELSRVVHGKPRNGQRKPSDVFAEEIVSQAKRYIHENYSLAVSLDELSKCCFVSPYHLCRVFKRKTGYSPIEYLTHYRIEVAKHYLMTTDRKIGGIAESVGYQSETYFLSLFKRIVGQTPGQYRTQEK
ncbi:AraC family transcriptional regulator [Paenibacillus albus]|nr:AraC family transcriptional regulator [Paenibacillus albus]